MARAAGQASAKATKKAATPAKKATSVVKKAVPEKKAPAAKKAAAKKAPVAKAAPAKKATAPKAAVKQAPVKQAPAAKAVAKEAPASKAPAKKAAPATKSVAKKAAPAKKAGSPYDAKFLAEMRTALGSERARYFHTAEVAKAEADELAQMREPGDVQFDDESGEGDTLAVERDFDLALSAQARLTVEEIDYALAKIDGGTYGLCEISGQPIPKARLEAIPWARERVEYKVGGFGQR